MKKHNKWSKITWVSQKIIFTTLNVISEKEKSANKDTLITFLTSKMIKGSQILYRSENDQGSQH